MASQWLRGAAMVAIAGMVAACTGTAPPPPSSSSSPPPPPRAADKRPVAAITSPIPPHPPGPKPPPPSSPPPVPVPAASLVGMSRDDAAAMLGIPARTTHQAAALVWGYGGGECALTLVFFPEVESGVYRVLTYDLTGGEAACLARLETAHGVRGK